MVFKIRIDVDTSLLDAKIKNMEAKLRQRLVNALELRGEVANTMMRWLAPYLTGYLYEHIDYFVNPEELFVEFHADAPYAAFPEFGTVKQRAQPYFRPPFWVAYFKLLEDIKNVIEETWNE